MASPPSPTRPFLTALSLAGAAAGFLTFAQVRYYWIQHATGRLEAPQYATLLPIAIAAILAMWAWRATPRHHRPRQTRRWTKALLPLAAGLPLALWQWTQWRLAADPNTAPTASPWPLYAWIALLGLCAWRAAPLIRLRDIPRRPAWLAIYAAVALMIALHISMQTRLWNDLSFGYHDIGLFARALHSAAAGRGFWIDSLDQSLLGEHTTFLLWALVPLCRIGLDPFSLLTFASTASLTAPALIVAWYLKHRFGSNLAALIGAIAWLMLPFHGCLVIERGYGFHPVSLAVPLLTAGLALTALRRWPGAAACMMLALLAREDLAFTVAAWAIYLAIVEKRRRLGATVATISLLYFAATVFLIIPHFRGETYPWILHHFDPTKESLSDLPTLTTNLSFIITLLLPMALLPLRSARLALIALPVLAESLLTTNPELHNIAAHYYTAAIPILFFAALHAWETSARTAADRSTPNNIITPSRSARATRPGWCLLIAACAGQTYLGIGPHTNNPAAAVSPPGLRRQIDNINRLRATAPRTATVTASYRIAAHFTDFDRLWTVKNEDLGDLVIIDDRDNWDGSNPRAALTRAHQAGGYHPIFADHHLVILSNDQGPAPLADELMPQQIPDGLTPIQIDLGSGIQLVAMRTTSLPATPTGPARLRITLIWTCRQTPPADLRFGLTSGDTGPRWGPFYFARGAYPTNIWKPGALYRDDLTIVLPPTAATKTHKLEPILLQ